MLILGIETSCDETSAAVVDSDGTVRSNLIASQIARHQPFGGVVPEIASREHLEQLTPVVRQTLTAAGVGLRDLDAIAVTSGPGLIGALLVGVAGAQGLAYGLNIPLYPVNHLEGHIYSPYLRSSGPAIDRPPRFLSLVISGGHSSIYDVKHDATITMLNRTRDDAVGEVFDKVAKFIGLPYPGGPEIERTAGGGDPLRFRFALPHFKDEPLSFSFSGLKSNAIRLARELKLDQGNEDGKADFCASFQHAIGNQILDRLESVWSSLGSGSEPPTELALAGGVAANETLRRRVEEWSLQRSITPRLPERAFCTDNGAMIAFAGLRRAEQGDSGDPRRVPARSRMAVGA